MEFFFDEAALQKVAKERCAAYAVAKPFPHAVIDGLVPTEILDEILKEFPTPEGIAWRTFNAPQERNKLASERDETMGPATRHLMAQFNGAAFASFLDTLTGIEGLIPDPYFKGGGLHQIVSGGSLGVHADFNYYKRLKLHRRVNALLYLNKDWQEEWGGGLELWDKEMTHAVMKVVPTIGRMVIFSTSDTSYHGHPDPLTCPPDRTRKSLALYYYTASDAPVDAHTTLFKARPGKDAAFARAPSAGWKRFVPPILIDAARALRRSHE